MKKLIWFELFFLIVLLLCPAMPSFAGELLMATGGEAGVYHKIGTYFLPKQLDGTLKVTCQTTQGSVENIKLLKEGKVQAAMLQMDALIMNPDLEVEIVGVTHQEYVHLITRADGDIKSITDLKKNHKIAVGRADSGTQVTWSSFCKEDASYKEIATLPLSGTIAMSKLSAGEVDAILMVSGLRGGDAVRANNAGTYRLAEVNDWDFNDTMYRGKKVYDFTKIPSNVYPGLTPGLFAGNVETVGIPAVLVVSSAWAMDNPTDFDRLFDATSRAIPNIAQFVSGKQ